MPLAFLILLLFFSFGVLKKTLEWKPLKLSCRISTAVSQTAESFFPLTTGGVTIRRRWCFVLENDIRRSLMRDGGDFFDFLFSIWFVFLGFRFKKLFVGEIRWSRYGEATLQRRLRQIHLRLRYHLLHLHLLLQLHLLRLILLRGSISDRFYLWPILRLHLP